MIDYRVRSEIRLIALSHLGPGALKPSDGPFCLSSTQWSTLTLSLLAIAHRAADVITIHPDIADLARQAQQMATAWQTEILPLSTTFARQLTTFGTTIATRYGQMDSGLGSLLNGDRDTARAQLQTAVREVYQQARDMHATAARLSEGVTTQATLAREIHEQFRVQTDRYQAALTTSDADVQRLNAAIHQAQHEVALHQQRYNEYVAIAATTVTYAWIPVLGWIAGGTVAGTYGSKAVDEKRLLDAAVERLARLQAELSVEYADLNRLEKATSDSRYLTEAFTNARPLIGQIQGIWDALASDLEAIGDALGDDLSHERILSLKLALQSAARAWSEVANDAAAYCANGPIAVVEPRFYGRYVTEIGYGGIRFPENHELVITADGVTVSGALVINPSFSLESLRFVEQPDARRDGKPVAATIQFTETGFYGSCSFPGEGFVEWYGSKV